MDIICKVPVLIVGGGPVGLALAGELGWRGIACILVEQGDGRIVTPKMNEVNARTMEFCRRWGIADAVYGCPFPPDYPLDVAFVTSLSGYELGRIVRPPRMSQAPGPDSPMRTQSCSQMWFDPILQNFARSFPHVSLRYGMRLDSFESHASGVVGEIVDVETGRRERIEAEYLVGCDGANSMVRRALGIELDGTTLGHPLHIYFRAPGLLEACGQKPTVFFLTIDREGLWANVRAIDPANAMWRLMVLDTDGTLTPETVEREGYLRRAVGRDVDVDWLGTSIWTRRSAVAERCSKGRVFLAGDAVHQLSPTGALGMNTGIGDAVDLGWKLAAVLDGWADERLLASYEAERLPIGQRNVAMAGEFYLAHEEFYRGVEAIEDATAEGEAVRRRVGQEIDRNVGAMFRTSGLQLGYRYENSPICLLDGTPPSPDHPENYVPSARPGSRAPHLWLDDGRSILDFFGRGFVLLRLGADAPNALAFVRAAAVRRVPLIIVDFNASDAVRLYEYPLVLVRPDGHVAWRGATVPAAVEAVIDTVRGAVAPRSRPR
jgi:2-polyprenyl-6-methoxyphenol hydroxylase-like FAD-dependent oxidoreductase